MGQSRPWSQYEDLILKRLKQEQKVQKWTVVAQRMADEYNLKGRNGKQCKERYYSITDENIQQEQWDYLQQQKLFQLHSQLGNKWAIIGQQLMNKSDNEVKNHLYSRLRKSLRKLNKTIKQHFKKEFKEIKQNLIYKIIEGAQDKFKNSPLLELQVSQYCTELKMKLLNYSYDDPHVNPLQDVENNFHNLKNFLQQLIEFSKDYKRKPKKVRRASGQILDSLLTDNIYTLTVPKQDYKVRSNGNSPCYSQVSQQDSDDIAEFGQFTLKTPLQLFGIKTSNKSNGSNKQIKQNIILCPPPDLTKLTHDMQEQTQHQNGYGGFFNYAPDPKTPEGQLSWNLKGSDNIWNIGKNESQWKANCSNEMVDEADPIQSQLKKVGLLEQEEDEYNPPMMKKLNISKRSSFSNFQIQEEQQHIFGEDSSYRIQMTGIEGKRFCVLDSSLQRSDRLFKSIDAFGMFQSVDSQHGDKLFQSIEKD